MVMDEVEYSFNYLIMNWTMDECEGSDDRIISRFPHFIKKFFLPDFAVEVLLLSLNKNATLDKLMERFFFA